MRALWPGLKLMLSYFTLLPVRFGKEDDLSHPDVLASMLFWLPFGGLLLGAIALIPYGVLAYPLEWMAALLSAVGYMMLYGFLHTEAIMDVADALYAKHSGKDAYEIIKEPTVGAMGVLWAVGMLLLKISAIVLLLSHEAYGLFLSVLIISRLGLLVLFFTQTFRSSFITTMQQGFKAPYLAAAFILYMGIGMILTGTHFLLLLFVGLGISYLIATAIAKKLGFMNGDVLGTTLESTEIVLFLVGGALWL